MAADTTNHDRSQKGVCFFALRPFTMHPRQTVIIPQNVIEIHRPALPIYQSAIEKTRGLSIRTQTLGAALSRTGHQQQMQPVEQPAVVEGA